MFFPRSGASANRSKAKKVYFKAGLSQPGSEEICDEIMIVLMSVSESRGRSAGGCSVAVSQKKVNGNMPIEARKNRVSPRS
jgi:hypothetical protein